VKYIKSNSIGFLANKRSAVCVFVAIRTTHTSRTVQQTCSGGQGIQMSSRYGIKWHNWHHALLADDFWWKSGNK